MSQELNLRPYKDGDEKLILKLFRAVYPGSKDQISDELWLNRWQWMYKENPSGEAVIWLAEGDNELAGQYAVIPVKTSKDHTELLGCLSLATMVHPNYRRRGIFENLAKKCYEESLSRGFQFVFGFPNSNSYPGFVKKLDWYNISELVNYIKPIHHSTWLRKKVNLSLLTPIVAWALKNIVWPHKRLLDKSLLTRHEESITEEFSDFWNQNNNDRYSVVKDQSYLQWRFFKTPDINYKLFTARENSSKKIKAFAIYRVVEVDGYKSAVIFNLSFENEHVLSTLIGQLIFELEKENIITLSWSGSIIPKIIEVLKKLNFTSRPPDPQSFLCAHHFSSDLDSFKLNHVESWSIFYGDSDML